MKIINKKLPAFVFSPSLSSNRQSQVMSLVMKRKKANIALRDVPCPAIHRPYMLAFGKVLDSHDQTWQNSSLYVYSPALSQAPADNLTTDTRLDQPVMVDTLSFSRPATIVYLQEGLAFKGRPLATKNKANGQMDDWTSAIRQLSQKGLYTVLIIDETTLYSPQEKQAMSNAFNQKRIQADRRHRLWSWAATLVPDEEPLYVYMHTYASSSTFSLSHALGWLQQRHQLDLTDSRLLYTGKSPPTLDAHAPTYLQLLHPEKLMEPSQGNGKQRQRDATSDDIEDTGLCHFSLEQLQMPLNEEALPLLVPGKSFSEKRIEESNECLHAILIKDATFDTLLARYVARNSQLDEPGTIQSLAFRAKYTTEDAIGTYIANTGAMARGKQLPPSSLSSTTYQWQGPNLRIQGKFKGTSEDPYEIWLNVGEKEILDGKCSCPVGDRGQCKHCVLLLFQLHEHVGRFEEIQNGTLQTTNGEISAEPIEKESDSVTPSRSEPPPPVPIARLPDGRRFLPWMLKAEEPPPKASRSRKRKADVALSEDGNDTIDQSGNETVDQSGNDAEKDKPKPKKKRTTKSKKIVSTATAAVADLNDPMDMQPDISTGDNIASENSMLSTSTHWSPSLAMEDGFPSPASSAPKRKPPSERKKGKAPAQASSDHHPVVSPANYVFPSPFDAYTDAGQTPSLPHEHDLSLSPPSSFPAQESALPPTPAETLANSDRIPSDDDDGSTTEDEDDDWNTREMVNQTPTSHPSSDTCSNPPSQSNLTQPLVDLGLSKSKMADSGSETEDEDEVPLRIVTSPKQPTASTMDIFDELGL
ncbi:hypothetical protein DM01DRAFT_304129 [Hesseltinella vesiculosa]|uniref:SWIM-type domain-containing protein n=1 Tax=Hesseltinella vesiculosa TaxID=101127 RepID=A0A1X2G4D0_9FUNG|nr:hypothetical protein DM01DRAFT_304129 [Hesseltinella vesiculosa]